MRARIALVFLTVLCQFVSALPADKDSAFAIRKHPEKVRGTFWRPLGTFFLPGLDQWREGQYDAAASYSVLGIGGIGIALASGAKLDDARSIDSKDDRLRTLLLGEQLYQAAGSYSAYHAFRTAVRSQPENFDFLSIEERPSELFLAPVRFDFLIRPTTFIPLAIGGAILAAAASGQNVFSVPLSGHDYFFAGSYSYLAGTNEEALFRGWLMPQWMRVTHNELAANGLTALVFGAAHISPDNPVPWPQFLVGAYLGWVSQYRDWTISESIFIHTWWDVMAFLGDYTFRDKNTAALSLPPVVLTF